MIERNSMGIEESKRIPIFLDTPMIALNRKRGRKNVENIEKYNNQETMRYKDGVSCNNQKYDKSIISSLVWQSMLDNLLSQMKRKLGETEKWFFL